MGVSGSAGVQGATGMTGGEGYAMAGRAGESGPAGDVGAQGPTGPTGVQGAPGIVGVWTPYRDFTFSNDQSNVQSSEMSTVTEIAAYMVNNPSLQLGIDGSTNPRDGDGPAQQNLDQQRAGAIRDALVQAGVPPSRIQIGALSDPQLRRNRQVEVLLRTGM
jgi:hypothetical protein